MIVSLPLNLDSKELRHFNPNIFGKSVDEQVTLLLPDESKEAILPRTILTDVDSKKRVYYGATIRYPMDLTFEQARASLNKLYGRYAVEKFKENPEMGLWRNEDEGYIIQMVIYLEGIEQYIHIIYWPLCKNNTQCTK